MLDIISKAIDQFYIKKDYYLFKENCKKQLMLFEELKSYIESHGLRLVEGNDKDSPSKEWYIHFDDYKKGEFEVSYNTILKISKVAPLFYLQHEFSVEDKDENRMTPVLDGFGGQPYTLEQAALNDKISAILSNKGYVELGYADINEVVEGFKMPEGVTLFGPNVTVEHLLFVDIFDICNNK